MTDQVNPPAPTATRGPAVQQDSEPQTILILGALGIVLVVTAPIAWFMGNRYLERCKKEGRQPDNAAEVGRILGMAMTILWGALIAMYLALMVVMVVMMVAFYAFFFVVMLVLMLAAAVA